MRTRSLSISWSEIRLDGISGNFSLMKELSIQQAKRYFQNSRRCPSIYWVCEWVLGQLPEICLHLQAHHRKSFHLFQNLQQIAVKNQSIDRLSRSSACCSYRCQWVKGSHGIEKCLQVLLSNFLWLHSKRKEWNCCTAGKSQRKYRIFRIH